jgi:hypothetical protein
MKTLALIVLLAGCAADAGDDFPLLTGGDSLPAAGQAGVVSGRICILSDPRNLAGCSASGADGLTVTLAGSAATTGVDGSFQLVAPQGGSPTVTPMVSVTGAGIVPTQISMSSAMSIPVLRADLFSQMMAANGITPSSGSGSILGTVLRGGVPAPGITVDVTPTPAFGPRFDGTTPTSFTLDATGARGVFWIPGVALGPTQLTFRDLATSGETTVGGVQVVNGGITIMDTVLP